MKNSQRYFRHFDQDTMTRRAFFGGTTTAAALSLLQPPFLCASNSSPKPGETKASPIGTPKGIHPGRVVWLHDPQLLDWKGPGDGRWYEANRTRQERADQIMARAVCELTGESTVAAAWDRLCRHLNRSRGKGELGYRPGEKFIIKPNWVGMIWREGAVDPEQYRLIKRQDYMNTSPQMILALVRQLVDSLGVKPSDISICDTLAYIVEEYYGILHGEFGEVRYVDHAGERGRVQARVSEVPLYWSCRPAEVKQDFIPTCFTEAEYLINFANLKAHAATGVTLCGKNHFGSLVRWPVEKGYYDMHQHSFRKEVRRYREQVDLMGHAHLGGKTVLYLIDGMFSGKHPVDPAPRRMNLSPFDGEWSKSLFASQDPVAIDSVGFDFLFAEYDDHPRRTGVDDYLHEAALVDAPPSETAYDPNHDSPLQPLASLGVHEHWNNPEDKQYSRNLGTGEGIELLPVRLET